MDCGEQALLPAVRQAGPDTPVVADGFSGKTPIADAGTRRRALHVAEVMQSPRPGPERGPGHGREQDAGAAPHPSGIWRSAKPVNRAVRVLARCVVEIWPSCRTVALSRSIAAAVRQQQRHPAGAGRGLVRVSRR